MTKNILLISLLGHSSLLLAENTQMINKAFATYGKLTPEQREVHDNFYNEFNDKIFIECRNMHPENNHLAIDLVAKIDEHGKVANLEEGDDGRKYFGVWAISGLQAALCVVGKVRHAQHPKPPFTPFYVRFRMEPYNQQLNQATPARDAASGAP